MLNDLITLRDRMLAKSATFANANIYIAPDHAAEEINCLVDDLNKILAQEGIKQDKSAHEELIEHNPKVLQFVRR